MDDRFRAILKQYWGYDDFRGIQADIIQSIVEGRDTLGLMPTGGGKSITFQVPAMSMPGLCIVVTPLIALMKDQVIHLKQRGIKAIAVYSGMTREQISIAYDNCQYGDFKFLYISPERLATEMFRNRVRGMNVNMIAVDESHCISQWGYDFRPSYLHIADIRLLLPDVPVLALTATATPQVVDDIQQRLLFREKRVFRMSFERKNLAYVVRQTSHKENELLHILTRMNQGSAIVYTRNRERTHEISRLLESEGITSTYYHAGLSTEEKDRRQHAWIAGEYRVMVATNAFGMGIDKPDVRIVVHMDFPDSIESYFQEAGRAGRDGLKAYAVLLHSKQDKSMLLKRIESSFPPKDYIRKVYDDVQYYLQMAMGDGRGSVHPFDLQKFSYNFHHYPMRAEGALNILTRAGYLEFTEVQDNQSRVIFKLRKDELYHIRRYDEKTECLLEGLMRFYTGIFTEPAYIDETQLAKFTAMTEEQVYERLLLLSRSGVIRYIPRSRSAFIIYPCDRIESERLSISREVYEERRAHMERCIEALWNYAERTEHCRSSMLLAYFGEEDAHDCGQCDVCLLRTKQHPIDTQTDDDKIAEAILNMLTDGPMALSSIVTTVPFESDQVKTVLTRMLADEMIAQHEGQIYLLST